MNIPTITNVNATLFLLKNNGLKIAIDIIGVKFGGCGINLENRTKKIIGNNLILLLNKFLFKFLIIALMQVNYIALYFIFTTTKFLQVPINKQKFLKMMI